MRSIKFIYIVLLLSSLNSFSQQVYSNKEISIRYLGFTHYVYPKNDWNYLLFEVTNLTNDTLYFFKNNFPSISVYKEGKKVESDFIRLKKELSNTICTMPVYPYMGLPPILTKSEQEKDSLLRTLKRNYVNRILSDKHDNKLSKLHISKQDLIEKAVMRFTILFPKTSAVYDVPFYSSSFDATCKVYATYEDRDIFSQLVERER